MVQTVSDWNIPPEFWMFISIAFAIGFEIIIYYHVYKKS